VADSTSALVTSESILIDGANGVTSAPRAHFPQAGLWLAVAIVVAVVVRLVRRPVVAVALLALGSLPGLVHVLALRADSPIKRGAMTDSIKVTLGDLQTRVPWPQSQVTVVREEDDVLFPLGRYALPSRTGGPLELVIGAGPLGQVCSHEGQRVTCGGAP
jgi:hypothetical protein